MVAAPHVGLHARAGAPPTRWPQANQQLALGSRIAQLQQDGEQAIVSFGGQANTSLDVACTSVADLTAAYQSVISAYHLTTIDLDIEGAALDDFGAEQRRAAGDRQPWSSGTARAQRLADAARSSRPGCRTTPCR